MSVETQVAPAEHGVEVSIKTARFPWTRLAIVVGAFVLLAGVSARFYQHSFDELWDREAIDQAQVASAIASGQGFVTLFGRPLNLALIPEGREKRAELNHGPIYPYVLATGLKHRSISDQVVAWASLAFLFATLVATYILGRLLFDWRTGLLAASALGVSAPILRIGISGQQWTMAALWFVLLLIAVALHHRRAFDELPQAPWWRSRLGGAGTLYAIAAAICSALLYMTHYILVFLVIPVAVYFAITGLRRKLHAAVFIALTLLLIAPYSYRNLAYTRFPVLGVNAWDLMAHTDVYPGDTLYRSTDEASRQISSLILFPVEHFSTFAQKLVSGSSETLGAVVSVLGLGILAFLLVSVLYRFKNPTANAVRGLAYGMLPLAIVCFALYSVARDAVIIFAPVAAVFAGAYLLLLLDSRKLHVFYRRVLVGCFLLLMANQTMAPLIWPAKGQADEGRNVPAQEYLKLLSSRGMQYSLYTDVPWIAAWRCRCWSIWLPMKDDDFIALEAMGFRPRVIILTAESGNYSPDEIWYVLHKVRLWREYIRDPDEALREILEIARVKSSDTAGVQKFVQRLRRGFAVSAALQGFKPQPYNPLAPDDIQVLTREESGP